MYLVGLNFGLSRYLDHTFRLGFFFSAKSLHFLALVGTWTELPISELAQLKLSQKVKSPTVLPYDMSFWLLNACCACVCIDSGTEQCWRCGAHACCRSGYTSSHDISGGHQATGAGWQQDWVAGLPATDSWIIALSTATSGTAATTTCSLHQPAK